MKKKKKPNRPDRKNLPFLAHSSCYIFSPGWFEQVIDAVRYCYHRIDRSELTCPFCKHPVHVATQYHPRSKRDITPACFVFCGCAQGLPDFLKSSTDKAWRSVACFFVYNVAVPGSEKHRRIMLSGIPSRAMVKGYTGSALFHSIPRRP
jgi:hypothetical protein